jgi:hypothetical protein
LVFFFVETSVQLSLFFFFIDFKSKKIRVNLNLPIKAEVKAESADVLKAVDEDRKYVIQATIVRFVPPFLPFITSQLMMTMNLES